MGEHVNAPAFQLVLEYDGSRLFFIPGDDDPPDLDLPVFEIVNDFEDIGFIGDAEIRAQFFAFVNIAGI